MNPQPSLQIPVRGLGCGGSGTAAIERRLAHASGVLRAYVNPATEIAYVEYDPTRTDATRLVRVIEQTGYRAGPAVEA